MKVTGFTFIRNAVINDYPIAEAINSILPLCDEVVVALGNSTVPLKIRQYFLKQILSALRS